MFVGLLFNQIANFWKATTRFFGRLRVRTSNEGLVRLGCISDSPYAHLVKTLEIQPVIESSEDPQSDIYWPEPSKCTFMGLDITPFHYFHTNHSEHPMKELLHRVFHQMKNLRSVVFLAPRLFFRGSDAAKWKGWYAPRMLQCKIINTLFGIIEDAISELDCVALEGFSSIVGEYSPLRHSLALPPSTPLDFKRYVASHKGLQIEYNPPRDRDGRVYDEMAFRSRGKLQNTWDSLLPALSCDRMTKSLEISIAGISLQQRVYDEERGLHYDAMVADAVFHHLSFKPSLFLHTLKLHQVHASGKCTVDQVIRVHTPTLREVYLDDIWLEPPNVARDLFEALASANLEYLGLRRFYWRKKFLGTRSLDCSKDHDPDLALDWPEQPADDTTDGTHESIVSEDDVALGRIEPSRSKQKDESYKDWVLMDWVQDDIDNWMEYGMHKKSPHEKSTHMVHGPVNTAMRRIVTRIDSGAIFAP